MATIPSARAEAWMHPHHYEALTSVLIDVATLATMELAPDDRRRIYAQAYMSRMVHHLFAEADNASISLSLGLPANTVITYGELAQAAGLALHHEFGRERLVDTMGTPQDYGPVIGAQVDAAIACVNGLAEQVILDGPLSVLQRPAAPVLGT